MKDIKTTRSICPECLKAIDATIFEDEGKVFIKKECPEHGAFQEFTGQITTNTCGQKNSAMMARE